MALATAADLPLLSVVAISDGGATKAGAIPATAFGSEDTCPSVFFVDTVLGAVTTVVAAL